MMNYDVVCFAAYCQTNPCGWIMDMHLDVQCFFPRVWCNDLPTGSANHQVDLDDFTIRIMGIITVCLSPWNFLLNVSNDFFFGWGVIFFSCQGLYKRECGCPEFRISHRFLHVSSLHSGLCPPPKRYQRDPKCFNHVIDDIYQCPTFQQLFCCYIPGCSWSISQTFGVGDSKNHPQVLWPQGVGNQLSSHKSRMFLAFWWFRGLIFG